MTGTEIERKFLVSGDVWRKGAQGAFCRQGYIVACDDHVVRVRVLGEKAYLTIKGRKTGLSCPEYEYPMPVADAQDMLARICLRPLIEKMRYTLDFKGMIWEIDEFTGENEGLVVAEVELAQEHQMIELPAWVGREVSFDPKYWNVNLMKHPYCRWSTEMRMR
ncbi:MAG: CYTH domain-containing protein [Syntrophales bacterium]|nr:CYTH domain-containing protein [Syntrophales bacterium]